jgi:hypothetical protein
MKKSMLYCVRSTPFSPETVRAKSPKEAAEVYRDCQERFRGRYDVFVYELCEPEAPCGLVYEREQTPRKFKIVNGKISHVFIASGDEIIAEIIV